MYGNPWYCRGTHRASWVPNSPCLTPVSTHSRVPFPGANLCRQRGEGCGGRGCADLHPCWRRRGPQWPAHWPCWAEWAAHQQCGPEWSASQQCGAAPYRCTAAAPSPWSPCQQRGSQRRCVASWGRPQWRPAQHSGPRCWVASPTSPCSDDGGWGLPTSPTLRRDGCSCRVDAALSGHIGSSRTSWAALSPWSSTAPSSGSHGTWRLCSGL